MSGSARMGVGQVWLRLGIFAMASVLLELAASAALGPLYSRLASGDQNVLYHAFMPVFALVPLLGAAVLAWLAPRRASLSKPGARQPWLWCLLLLVIGFVIVAFLRLSSTQINGWSDSNAIRHEVIEAWIWLLVAVPQALMMALIGMTFLWGTARNALSASSAGVMVAVAFMLSSVAVDVTRMITAPDSWGMNGGIVDWMAATLLSAACWAVLYSGLGRLLDGRGPWARAFLALLVLAPVYLAIHPLGVDWGSALGGLFSSFPYQWVPRALVPLTAGILAWLFSLRRG